MRETFEAYGRDQISRQAAALAYFTIFALAPLLVVLIEIAALLLGGHGHGQQVRDQIVASIASGSGKESAGALRAIMQATLDQARRQGLIAGIIGWIVLLLAATGLVGAIQGALDDIWHVAQEKRPGWSAIKDRSISFALIAAVAFVLLVSLGVNTGIAAVTKSLSGTFPEITVVASVVDFALSLIVIASLFAAAFKFLPHVKIAWKDVMLGALVSALFFVGGQLGLSWYLGRAGTASSFGAAGSLVVLVLWIYYSGQIFLLGAEFTKIYAHRRAQATASSQSPVSD